MDRKIVNNLLQKIVETHTLFLKEDIEIRFIKVYEGILFNTIIPHRGDREGLYKLTVKGKSVLSSGRNQ